MVIIIYLFSNADNASAKRGLNAIICSPIVQLLPSNATSNATKYYPSRNSENSSLSSVAFLSEKSSLLAHSIDAPAAEAGAFGSMLSMLSGTRAPLLSRSRCRNLGLMTSC